MPIYTTIYVIYYNINYITYFIYAVYIYVVIHASATNSLVDMTSTNCFVSQGD